MTSTASRSAISSRVAGSGRSRRALLDGMMLDLFGPEAAPASPSPPPAKAGEPMIQGICGRTFIASSVPAGPLSSWESRLRERLGMVGSTESALIWRQKITPAGASISRLAPSTRHTNGTGSTGSHCPTPSVANATGGQSSRSGDRKDEMLLSGLMREADAAMWSTPRASDGEKGGPNQSFGAGGQPLPSQMHQAERWRSPNTVDAKGGTRKGTGQVQLTHQIADTAKWPTMCATETGQHPDTTIARKQRLSESTGVHRGPAFELSSIMVATDPPGPTPTGSPVTTEKRGAPNPVFAFWLMGFPDEWISGALAAMQSYRSKRQKSSVRSSKRS